MNKTIFYIILIFVLLLLSGCVHTQPKQAPSQTSTPSVSSMTHSNETATTSDEETQTSEEAGFLTGDKFKQNSDFVVKAFQISYDKAKNKLSYHIEYKLGADATAFLKNGKHKYYFRLEAPEKWHSFLTSSKSGEVQGAQLTGDLENIYSVDLVLSLHDGVTDQKIQEMVKDPYDYVLYLYENPEYPARMVGNVYGWMKNS